MRPLSLALLVLCCSFAAHAEAPQQQLNATLDNLQKSKETEAELKKKLGATEQEMETMRERAAAIGERLQISERRVSSQESALATVNEQVAQKKKEFEDRKEDYTKTVLSLLRMRALPPTALFSRDTDAKQLLRTASVLEKTNQAVADKAARLRQDIAQLKKLQGDAKARDIATKAEKVNLKAEQDNLARELSARQKLQAKLNADHAKAEQQVAELSHQSQSLQELIGKLDAKSKADAQARASKPEPKLRSFDGKKGSARTPVTGDIIHRFGEKQNGNSTYRGMVFKARAGATVVAPFDGEIVFTGPFRDYGNMVLIKHKNGYISLIAGLSKVTASLNQAAIRGEPIGTMPDSGPLETYVELRDSSAKPIDPANWFANVVSK